MGIRLGNTENSVKIYFGGLPNHPTLSLSHRVQKTGLYILKTRDITLPTKVHLVKVMVFPVVMNGCESWTIKKAEHQRIDAFEL